MFYYVASESHGRHWGSGVGLELADVVEERAGNDKVHVYGNLEVCVMPGNIACAESDGDRVFEEAASVGVVKRDCGGPELELFPQVVSEEDCLEEVSEVSALDFVDEGLEGGFEVLYFYGRSFAEHVGREVALVEVVDCVEVELQLLSELCGPALYFDGRAFPAEAAVVGVDGELVAALSVPPDGVGPDFAVKVAGGVADGHFPEGIVVAVFAPREL